MEYLYSFSIKSPHIANKGLFNALFIHTFNCIIMKLVIKLLCVCFLLLVGIGLQEMCVGLTFGKPVNFDAFSTFNWIVETIYITLLICLGLLWADNENKESKK